MRDWLDFQGRIGRRTFWLAYVLPIFGAEILASLVDIGLGLYTMAPFTILVSLLSIWPGLAAQVKRWHDHDRSGWWVLIQLVPLVGPIYALVMIGFLRGTPGPNRFGPDPLGDAAAMPATPPMRA
ncbi:DUF805 domain-containing protein [Roseomonas sp. NAR14]|uniref:DUF805 domain-containing protein n=1 Tax=Roseomonas acroporae TaxID=2937791 RepID=A0A9X2BTX2_9PROT|nr:DUF805 domain-containing protein [Roseomonas acroporae]MCK8783611.1 DUF805 domain-containing protein [Roseomonas acroporae]